MPPRSYTDEELNATIEQLTDPAALRAGQDVVMRAAPQLNLFGIGFTITLLSGFFVLLVGLDGIMAGISSLLNSALMAASELVGANAAGAP